MPSPTAPYKIPNDSKSGARPIVKASQKLGRLLRPNAIAPHKPCDRISTVGTSCAQDCENPSSKAILTHAESAQAHDRCKAAGTVTLDRTSPRRTLARWAPG